MWFPVAVYESAQTAGHAPFTFSAFVIGDWALYALVVQYF